ncbi:hypothetical protein NE237_000844 [Protea cynaroides]|uniref:Sieve element occlusion N-terminal domain-containing protein n=1 Tax=Protea cynaroides TaxID=273540 RepID=A0A9Q0KRX6_9MAGN|nr:hypothetical protein NE237_000844 [Protea cynaroides]
MLLQYSWEMKMVLALAAFVIIYGESLSTADQTNPLAKSIKPLKQLPGKSKLSKIRSLIHSIVKITNKIFDINDLMNLNYNLIYNLQLQVWCKYLGGGDVNSKMMALFKTLSPYSWEVKMVLALAAFAIIYEES